ncbi:MAG: hypothetical protein JNK72_24720 [Myxococcales bacterium]|nr:hypothetical protein [Myxococcales bacterium]
MYEEQYPLWRANPDDGTPAARSVAKEIGKSLGLAAAVAPLTLLANHLLGKILPLTMSGQTRGFVIGGVDLALGAGLHAVGPESMRGELDTAGKVVATVGAATALSPLVAEYVAQPIDRALAPAAPVVGAPAPLAAALPAPSTVAPSGFVMGQDGRLYPAAGNFQPRF